jgi:adenine-specific DNA-methyltransferase
MTEKNYQRWSKEKLIQEAVELKRRKKYGLVWEEEKEPERVVLECQEKLPILKDEKNKEILLNKEKPTNLLIEGDNYHALQVLNYTHKGMVDVIYIDPPFNTGAKNWKYNNNYVDKDDSYRHSKWLNLMNKRLKLAKELLKDDGVLICAIDENELWHLGCLLEEIFFNYEIHPITIIHNPRGVQGKNFSYTNEFAFFVFPKGKQIIGPRKLDEDEIYWSNLRNWGGESLRKNAKNCFYPIIIKRNKIVGFGDIPKNDFHPKKQTEKKDNKYYVWPIDVKGIERKWRYAKQSVESIIDLLRIKKLKDRIEIEIGKPYGKVRTVWQNKKYDAAEYGTKLVHALVPDAHFDFPKSIYNVYDCLRPIVSQKKNALILDFFAGSGTTGHSVALLNNEDGGKRKFILCTNNENNISEEITYPRLKGITKKNKKYPDITEIKLNLKYFKTDFIDVGNVYNISDEHKIELTYKAGEMIAIKEDVFEEVEKNKWWQIFRNKDKKVAIYFREDQSKLEKLFEKLRKDKTIVYLFSWGKNEIKPSEYGYDNIKIKDIPQPIIDVYKEINRL